MALDIETLYELRCNSQFTSVAESVIVTTTHAAHQPSYVHHVPGRLRLRCATLKNNARLGVAISDALRNEDGVTSVTVNPVNGSLKVVYQPAVAQVDAIAARLRHLSITADLRFPQMRGEGTGPRASSIDRAVAQKVVEIVLQAAVEKSLSLLIASVL